MALSSIPAERRVGYQVIGTARVRSLQVISDSRSWHFFDDQPTFFRENGVEFIGASACGPGQREFSLANHLSVHTIPIKRRYLSPFSDLLAIWRLFRLIRQIRPHIVHAHFSKSSIIGMIAGVLARTPIRIYHNHGMALCCAHGWKWLALWTSEKLSCLLAHRVIYVAPSVLADAQRLGVCGPGKSCVILSANGLDSTNRFTPTPDGPLHRSRWRSALSIPQESFVVGFVGRILKDKGVDDLIRAWQLLSRDEPRLHLMLVGEFDPRAPLSPDTELAIRSECRIHHAGFVGDIETVYPAMDVLALPSYHEGLPYSLLEGSAMELPLIATRITGIVDVVNDGATGILVDPECPDQLATAMARYLHNPQIAQAHGKAGRAFVVEKFQRNAVWQRILQTYDQLLSSRLPNYSGFRVKRVKAADTVTP